MFCLITLSATFTSTETLSKGLSMKISKLLLSVLVLAAFAALEAKADMVCTDQNTGQTIQVTELIINGTVFQTRSIFRVGTSGNILISNPVVVKKDDYTNPGTNPKRTVLFTDPESTLEIVADSAAAPLFGHAIGTYWQIEHGTPTPMNPTGEFYSSQNFDPSETWNCQE
jgi:hypothetical protein